MLGARGQRIALDLQVGPLSCRGSAFQLHQVLLNLIGNASDATPHGGVVTVRVRSEGAQRCIEVLDTGPGFPDRLLPHIFEPFFTTKRYGTGLGLSICRRVITAHGGTISAENQPGGGGIVTVRLPAPSEG
jgi:signal transduction histidine kinase